MADQLPDVPSLCNLEPPPDGLVRLREAIERDDERRSGRRRWWFATVPVAAVIALALWSRRDHEEIIALPEVVEPAPPIADPAIAPAFYWVASTPGRVAVPQTAPVTYVGANDVTPVGELRLR